MRRRRFLAGCAACAALAPAAAWAQGAWQMPARFARPEPGSEEGGLWALMDREEAKLRRSPFAVREGPLADYVASIACRLAGAHCPDVRVHVVATPEFNANMAPNGMMQVWTGLLLRMENEAQLAAVIGHEIGHYVARHQLEQLREAKSRAAFGQFLALFGLVGAIGQLGMVAGMFAYSREHESAADRIGLQLMREAGYDTAEAARVWANLRHETEARPEGIAASPLFATHPAPLERQVELEKLAGAPGRGATGAQAWHKAVRPYLREWLNDEVRRGRPAESIALFSRMIPGAAAPGEFLHARAEVLRRRASGADLEAARADYEAAIASGSAPPDAHRGLGLILRQRGERDAARARLERYLELAPGAPDAAMIRTYIGELRT